MKRSGRSELWVVLVAVVAGAVAYGLTSGQDRWGALLGVGLAAGSSGVALVLKRWGVAHSLQASMAVMGAVFLFRLVLVMGGLVAAKGHGGAMGFVAGFFLPYFVLQWIEINDALEEDKRRRGEK